LSRTIKGLVEEFDSEVDSSEDSKGMLIPLPNVKTPHLEWILEFCALHCANATDKISEVVKSLDKTHIFDIILAANYLDIDVLLDMVCNEVSDRLRDKSPEQIRLEFGLDNDFTEAEEARIREETQWCI
jgi:S-phase kinase-associated protein 1